MSELEDQKHIEALEALLRKPSKVTEQVEFPNWETLVSRSPRQEWSGPSSSPNKVLSFFRKPAGLTLVGGTSFAIAATILFVFIMRPETTSNEVSSSAVMEKKREILSPLSVSVSQVKGKVFIFPEGSVTKVPLVEKYQITSGDIITTELASQVDLQFETGSWLRINPQSEVIVQSLQKSDIGSYSQKFSVKKGKLFASVSKLSKDSEFIVQAGEHLTQVRGTIFSISYDGVMETVAVREGSVAFGDLILNAKQQAVVKQGESFPVIASQVSPKEDKELKAFYTQSILAKESLLYREHSRLELVRLEDGTEYRGVILGQSETHLHFQGMDGKIEIPIKNILETEKIR
ncbi:LipL45-related protein [Leptospira ellinghausenii]|uniref:LipL45-related protein n=1 Tax=Leptospira ellinghausenii TaxID=1917822 RepID=A0A2P2DHK7_9LEPT|nr:FecR family protein [Leptospira ellinghausenii]GBF44122.1 LipL45-related protein [Leptospira ellinghausenii]